jgi:hypothetical protein
MGKITWRELVSQIEGGAVNLDDLREEARSAFKAVLTDGIGGKGPQETARNDASTGTPEQGARLDIAQEGVPRARDADERDGPRS